MNVEQKNKTVLISVLFYMVALSRALCWRPVHSAQQSQCGLKKEIGDLRVYGALKTS